MNKKSALLIAGAVISVLWVCEGHAIRLTPRLYLGFSMLEYGSFPLMDDSYDYFHSLSHEVTLGYIFHGWIPRYNQNYGFAGLLVEPSFAVGEVRHPEKDSTLVYKVGGSALFVLMEFLLVYKVGLEAYYGGSYQREDVFRFVQVGGSGRFGISILTFLNASLGYTYRMAGYEEGLRSHDVYVKVSFLRYYLSLYQYRPPPTQYFSKEKRPRL